MTLVTRPALAAAVVAGLFAGCVGGSPGNGDDARIGPLSGNGSGGGAVANVAPTVPAFSVAPGNAENDGSSTVVFTGQARDGNGETNVATLTLDATGPAVVTTARAVTPLDRSTTAEPASFGADGWKVWSGADTRDGVLHFKHGWSVPRFQPSGTYSWAATARDAAAAAGSSASAALAVASFGLVEIAPAPVRAHGTPDSGPWGGWSASPGTANVASVNYVKITNAGDLAGQRVVIDFTPAAFAGADDASFSVPIDGNVQFAVFEDTSPASTRPDEGSFAFQAVAGQGSVTVQFSGRGNVAYVGYRIVALPAVLSAQAYTAAYTVTEV